MSRIAADVVASFTATGAGTFTVDAAVDVAEGESLVVLGPSGSGKTLLLETIAGFHDHEGPVTVDGASVAGTPPEDRDFGFVFQDYALFPHRTVIENVAYGTRYHEDTREPAALLDDFGVGDLAERYPTTLSGGEKQRVALARALAVKPSVMLLDEPLAALDVPTRQSLRDDLADALADVTTIYVTHNRTTARALADRVAVMQDGRIVQTGPTEAVFERPTNPAVARFTGANVVDLDTTPALRDALDRSGTVAVRPERVAVGDGPITATVQRVVREDAAHRVTLAVDGATVDAFTDHPPAVGETVGLSIPAEHVHQC